MADQTEEITHVWVSPDEISILCEFDSGYRHVYYLEHKQVVRVRQAVILGKGNQNFVAEVERVFMRNPWAELIIKYTHHPMNWKIKAHEAMMARYQTKREEEARQRLTTAQTDMKDEVF
jgi:hypothetical protein